MAAQRKHNWLARNWPWALPLGCGGLLAMAAGAVALFVVGVFGLMKSSEPYETALARATSHAEVVASLGHPVEAGFTVTGHVGTSGSGGSATLAIPISGPRGNGTIHVDASSRSGSWSYQRLEVQIGDRTISLLPREPVTRSSSPVPTGALQTGHALACN